MEQSSTDALWGLLAHARQTTAYYASRIPDPRDVPADDGRAWLAATPLLSRSDIRREPSALHSSVGDRSTWRVARTTGTTGEPIEVVVDERTRSQESLSLSSHLDRSLGEPQWRTRDVVHIAMHAGASSISARAPWNASSLVVKWNLLRAWQASDPCFLACLARLDGQVVTSMPSVMDLIAARVRRCGANGRVGMLGVVLSGETVESATRDQVEEAFRCPVTALYTLAEAGIVGRGCPDTGGYHVAEEAMVVEIVDGSERAVGARTEGEVLVTSLVNWAMPLIRYRTGDRARWADRACSAGCPGRLLFLSSGRRPTSVITASGGTINVIRFAKVLANLRVNRVSLSQRTNGAVNVAYEADHPLGAADHALLSSAVRRAMGPNAAIEVRREFKPDDSGSRAHDRGSVGSVATAEPEGLHPKEIATWLGVVLADDPEIEAAVITGSSLDPETSTRFSDIDVVVLVSRGAEDPRWRVIARSLAIQMPGLRVHVDRLAGLGGRAPLLACRLLVEQMPVVGRLTTDLLPWPSPGAIESQARFWAQDARALLWSRLTTLAPARDTLHEAWFASKLSLDALRYRLLLSGERRTAARAVLKLARPFSESSWFPHVIEAFDVAREHRPPPDPGDDPAERYLAASLACVEATAAEFEHTGIEPRPPSRS